MDPHPISRRLPGLLLAIVLVAGIALGGCHREGQPQGRVHRPPDEPNPQGGLISAVERPPAEPAPAAAEPGTRAAPAAIDTAGLQRALEGVLHLSVGGRPGSGVAIGDDGTVLIAAAFLAAGGDVLVRAGDGAERPALVIGTDDATGLALLKIDGPVRALAPAPIDPVALAAAPAVAIGRVSGSGHNITLGTVSAETVETEKGEGVLLRSDAVHTENLGGALVTPAGGLLGIIVRFEGGDRTQPHGWAVPAPAALDAAQRIRQQTGGPSRIGVVTQPLDAPLAAALGLAGACGILVTDVAEGGPAARAGLAVGDAILSVDGFPICTQAEWRREMGAAERGPAASLEVFRAGEKKTVQVPLAAAGPGPAAEVFGMYLAGGPDGTVLVSTVLPGSPAEAAGVRPGDALVAVAGERITSPESARAAVERARSPVLLRLAYRGGSYFRAFPKTEPAAPAR